MQFGKFQGSLLAVLGLLLVALQAYFYHLFAVTAQPNSNSTGGIQATHGPWVGIIGALCLAGGAAIYFTAQRRDEPHPDNAVK
jgi:hypothetical protein